MPYAFLFIGLILAMVAYKNTQKELGAQLSKDLTGPNSFFTWIGAILIVGAIGYYAPARNVSRALLFLIIVVLLLSNQGFFPRLIEALRNPQSGSRNPNPTDIAGAGNGIGDWIIRRSLGELGSATGQGSNVPEGEGQGGTGNPGGTNSDGIPEITIPAPGGGN